MSIIMQKKDQNGSRENMTRGGCRIYFDKKGVGVNTQGEGVKFSCIYDAKIRKSQVTSFQLSGAKIKNKRGQFVHWKNVGCGMTDHGKDIFLLDSPCDVG